MHTGQYRGIKIMIRSGIFSVVAIALLCLMNIGLFEYLITSRTNKVDLQHLREKTTQIHQLLAISAESVKSQNIKVEQGSGLTMDYLDSQRLMGKIFRKYQEQYPAGLQFEYIFNHTIKQDEKSQNPENIALEYFQKNSQAQVWFEDNSIADQQKEYQYFHPIWLNKNAGKTPKLHGITRISVPKTSIKPIGQIASNQDLCSIRSLLFRLHTYYLAALSPLVSWWHQTARLRYGSDKTGGVRLSNSS